MARKTNKTGRKSVEALTHEEATRKNIPTAEYQSVMQKEEQSAVRVLVELSVVGFVVLVFLFEWGGGRGGGELCGVGLEWVWIGRDVTAVVLMIRFL